MADLDVRSGIHQKESSPLDGFKQKRGLRPRTLVLSLVLIVVSLFACYRFGVFDETIPAQAPVAIVQAEESTPVSAVPQPLPSILRRAIGSDPSASLSTGFRTTWLVSTVPGSLSSCPSWIRPQSLRLFVSQIAFHSFGNLRESVSPDWTT